MVEPGLIRGRRNGLRSVLFLEAGGIEISQRAGSERGEAVSCFGSRRIREREDTSVTKCPR